VGTFHAYSTKRLPNGIANLLGARRKFNQLRARIAVSEAAAWTGQRWFGGEYRVIPNGVDIDAPPARPKPRSDEFRLLFVGRPEERKGLPVLVQAFEGLVEHVPTRLTVIGADQEDVQRYLADPALGSRVEALGRVDGDELWRHLHEADVLCAPSLAGESFGMVLTEAFAAGTPVIASAIAGYSDVVTDGADGVLVPPADPQRLAEELQRIYLEPDRREAMGRTARETAVHYAWPRVAEQVEEVYNQVQDTPPPAPTASRLARRAGMARIDGGPRRPPKRLPSLDPPPAQAVARHRVARRIGLGIAALLGIGLTELAAHRSHTGDVPRAARHARVAVRPQHRRPHLAGRDHRRLHGPVPPQLHAALRVQPRAALGPGRGDAGPGPGAPAQCRWPARPAGPDGARGAAPRA
jgi:phosphatidylinositol alpha-mannosyltransferase